MDFGTPLPYKLALIHRLMGGEIVVEVRPRPIQILVADMFRSPVEVSEHMTATRLCMLHHVSHCQPSFTPFFNAIIQPFKGAVNTIKKWCSKLYHFCEMELARGYPLTP